MADLKLIPPVCGCCYMTDIGISCCCANCCFPCNIFTWDTAMKSVSVEDTARRDATMWQALALCLGADFPVLLCIGAFFGGRARDSLKERIGIPSYACSDSYCTRCCCMSYVLCQEVDAVLQYRKRSDPSITYGPISSCECCAMKASPSSSSQTEPSTKYPVVGRIERQTHVR